MLGDLLTAWFDRIGDFILVVFHYIFPEYPTVGYAVVISAALFFGYYLVRLKPISAAKMAISTLVTLCFLLFVLHMLIKLYRVVV